MVSVLCYSGQLRVFDPQKRHLFALFLFLFITYKQARSIQQSYKTSKNDSVSDSDKYFVVVIFPKFSERVIQMPWAADQVSSRLRGLQYSQIGWSCLSTGQAHVSAPTASTLDRLLSTQSLS